jgi:outer membrane immunogenic protein
MQIRALVAAAAALVITTAAQADGPPPGPPPPVAIACCGPPALWTGVYLGTHIGGGWSDPTWSFPLVEDFSTIPGQSFSPSASGLIWGGHVGINYQFHGNLLVGAELGYAGNRLSARTMGPFPGAPLDQFHLDGSDLFTLAARFGYVFHDQYLFYGKAGFASSLLEARALSTSVLPAGGIATIAAHAQDRENGWLVGVGFESRVISNIIFGVEYNYIDFSDGSFSGVTGGTAPGAGGPFNADIGNLHMQTFVARLSILFGPQACCSEGVLGKY